jgi:hypothetical protein
MGSSAFPSTKINKMTKIRPRPTIMLTHGDERPYLRIWLIPKTNKKIPAEELKVPIRSKLIPSSCTWSLLRRKRARKIITRLIGART